MSGIQNIRDGLTGNVTKVIVVAIIITFIGLIYVSTKISEFSIIPFFF